MASFSITTLLAFKRWADQQTLAAIATIDDSLYAEQKNNDQVDESYLCC